MQLLYRFALLADELPDVVPGGASGEDVFEHVKGGEVGRLFLNLADALAYLGLVYQYLGVPETILGAIAEEWITALDRHLLDMEIVLLFLLERVQKGHRLVRLRKFVVI